MLMKSLPVKILALFTVLLPQWAELPAQTAGYPDFEIVESIPRGTVLGTPSIREAYKVWLEMIQGAAGTIDLEEFYISNRVGTELDSIIAALREAASRGVKIRFVLDAGMYKTYPETADSMAQIPNISVRRIDFRKISGGVQHAKFFIVDRREIFLGSQNFDWRALEHIHEVGVRIRHTGAVSIYQDIFDLDWQLAEDNAPADPETAVSRKSYVTPFKIPEGPGDTLVFSPVLSPRSLITDTLLWEEQKIVDIIERAKKYLCCQVLTYQPQDRSGEFYPVLDGALRRAAGRGVSVKMIVSDWSIGPQAIGFLKNLAAVRNIQVKYSSIPDWSGGYIPYARVEHCKFMAADSLYGWIGTSNWEKGYFYSLRNVGVAVENSRISGILEKIFMKSWDGPYTAFIRPEGGEYRVRQHGEKN